MLKRIFSFLFIFALLLPVQALAANETEAASIIYFEDGSYITITINVFESRASGSKTGQKNYVYTSNSGTVCWDATLTGTFTYTGSSATCTYSDCSVTVYENNWYIVSKSAAKSGNTATATVTMGRKVLGITIAKDTYNMALSCDANGNLS